MKYEIKDQLFSAELVESLAQRKGQTPADFGLPEGQRISDETVRIFSMARNLWSHFRQVISNIDPHKTGVSETRKWMQPFFNLLGYDLQYNPAALEVDEARFIISHGDISKDHFPVHIDSFRQSLDQNPEGYRGNRQSPHVQMQEYLNHTEHLYGIITNGKQIRLLRDHHRLTGIQYLEWDLESIMEENDMASFTTLYRLSHVSRIPARMGDESLLEAYHNESEEEGHRVREVLRTNVSKCLQQLGNSFLQQAENEALRKQLETGELDAKTYWKHLRRLVYRLLFLFVAEERELIHREGTDATIRNLYREHYSLSRIRDLAESKWRMSPRFTDVWEQLKNTFALFEKEHLGAPLGITPLGGELFSPEALGPLNEARLSNKTFLEAFDLLSRFPKKQHRLRINYRRMNVEEFGAVYESLLDLHPRINDGFTSLSFSHENGVDRKSTGSYYTHKELVEQLLKTALYPVIKDRLDQVKSAYPRHNVPQKALEQALLSIKVCDPACGSGHFLLAAARALATELAHLRVPRGASINEALPQARRDVIEHCIYGVDLNPDALELCHLVLWIEAHGTGKPITFLKHQVKCGNSLIGWLDPDKEPLITAGAYKAVTGDNKEVTLLCKKQNAKEQNRTEQLSFDQENPYLSLVEVQNTYLQLSNITTESLYQIEEKTEAYQNWQESLAQRPEKRLYDAWAYAYFQPYEGKDGDYITQEWLKQLAHNRVDPEHPLVQKVAQAAQEMRFFHWPLEFPHVFACEKERRGFDVVLGNPPWERIKLQEKEFFANCSPEIALAQNASKRKKLIAALPKKGDLYQSFIAAKQEAEKKSKFLREGGEYPMTGLGDVNTYSVFSERILKLVSSKGQAGFIVPTGIVTDHNTRHFFRHVVTDKVIHSLYDFSNQKSLFPDVFKAFKFSLLTLVGNKSVVNYTKYAFCLQETSNLSSSSRAFRLSKADLEDVNPNSKTCPIFRTKVDALIARKIYSAYPILIRDSDRCNPWNVSLNQPFHMAGDSKYFKLTVYKSNDELHQISNTSQQLGALFEAKMFGLYNHRFASFVSEGKVLGASFQMKSEELLRNPASHTAPRYLIPRELIKERFPSFVQSGWYIAYRNICRNTDYRTFISSILPLSGLGHSATMLTCNQSPSLKSVLLAITSSLVFDYMCRLKSGSMNLTKACVKQLPIIPPEQFELKDLQFIVPRVLELSYTAWDLKAFADDVWAEADDTLRDIILKRWENNKLAIDIPEYETPDWVEHHKGEFPRHPFRWDNEYRLQIQCELDAYFAYKYGLKTEELKYILDPTTSELVGATQEEREKFPGETFRVLKKKELKKYGEFKTFKLVMQAWQSKPWEHPAEVLSLAQQTSKRPPRNYTLAKQMPLVMARIIELHEKRPKYSRTLGRTKMEKLLHLIENRTTDLGRSPIKDNFGPADAELRVQQENNAQQNALFEAVSENPRDPKSKYRYYKLENFQAALDQFHERFAKHLKEIDRIIGLFLDFDSKKSELTGTVYAVWNNLLIKQEPDITDDLVVSGCVAWSESKGQYNKTQWLNSIQWLRDNDLLPKGEGKLVT